MFKAILPTVGSKRPAPDADSRDSGVLRPSGRENRQRDGEKRQRIGSEQAKFRAVEVVATDRAFEKMLVGLPEVFVSSAYIALVG